MYPHRTFYAVLLFVALFAPVVCQGATQGPPANVVLVSGNGQVVQEQFLTTVPMTIRVTDASGIAVPGVPVSWSITQGTSAGSLNQPLSRTDSNGLATSKFLGSFVQPGLSTLAAVITASTSVGSVNFFLTVVPVHTSSGAPSQLPFVQLNSPALDNPVVTGAAGSTLPAAVAVAVVAQGGLDQGKGIPNVGVRIVSANTDPSMPAPPPPAACNAPGGIALTDARGIATCDLILGNTPGTYAVNGLAGEFQNTRSFTIKITSGQSCTFTVAPLSQSFGATAGNGMFNVTAASGCAWTAVSNAPAFITIASGASGSGNGTVSYMVAANTGASRSGTITVAGQTFAISQSGAGPGPLSITSGQNLPGAIANSTYTATLTASGGQPPYTWQIASGALPPGLVLASSTGAIAGTPTSAGTYTFMVTLSDSAGAQQSQSFTIAVTTAGSGLAITNGPFPAGIAGVPYNQVLMYSGSCGSPFAPLPVFSLASGSLPTGLSVQSNGSGYSITGTPTTPGSFAFTLGVSNSCGQTASAAFTIVINSTGVTTVLSASPTSLMFNVVQNGTMAPTLSLMVTSTGTAAAITVTAGATTGGNWLAVTPASATTPATVTVSASNYQTLSPGSYQGSIVVTASGSNSLTVPVMLNVAASTTTLSVSPTAFTFNLPTSSSSQQQVTVSSTGGAVGFTTTVQPANSWLSVQSSSGSTPASLTVGVNTTGLLPGGPYLGTVTVAPASGVLQPIQVTLFVSANGIKVDTPSLAFSFQPGNTSPAPQTLNLIFTGAQVPVTVAATTDTGANWLFATPSGGPVPTAVTVSVNTASLAPGVYNGSVTLTPTDPTIATIKVPVTLTIAAMTGPIVTGIANAASFATGQVAPGEIVTIAGTGTGPANPAGLTVTSSNQVATTLSGTQVLFDGIPAPLIYVSAVQINAIVPYEIYGRARTQLQVQYNGALSAPIDLTVATSAPGIFLRPPPMNEAASLNQDQTINSPANPAMPGSIITLYATGEGQTSPAGTTGAITGSVLPQPLIPITVQIGGLPADVLYYGTAPGLVAGVLQVNARIPASVPRGGPVTVTLMSGNATSNQATIAIAP